MADRGRARRRGAGHRAGRLTGAVDVVFSFTQLLLAVILIILVLMHSGKDTGLSGMFNPGQSQFGGTAVMERNLTRLTIVIAVLFAINGVILGFVL
jgi:preprotein translocase subunit SecG